MGCWNATDTLGGAPIKAYDDIKVIIYSMNSFPSNASGHSYPTETGKPISFVFDGSYDDTGGICAVKTFSLQARIFMDKMKECWYNGKLRIDNFTDCIDTIWIEKFINDYIERGLVFLTDIMGNESQLGLLIYSSVVYECVKKEMFEHQDIAYSEFNPNLLSFCIDYSERFSREYGLVSINRIKENYPNISDEDVQYFHNLSDDKYFGESEIGKYFEHGRILPTEFFNYYYDQIIDYYSEETNISIGMMFEELISLNTMMDVLRKSYAPLSGKGSQSFCVDAYRGLIKGIELQIKNEELL